jgi:hypothetical protein
MLVKKKLAAVMKDRDRVSESLSLSASLTPPHAVSPASQANAE